MVIPLTIRPTRGIWSTNSSFSKEGRHVSLALFVTLH